MNIEIFIFYQYIKISSTILIKDTLLEFSAVVYTGEKCWSQISFIFYIDEELFSIENSKNASDMADENDDFLKPKHIKFFERCLQILPSRYCSLDTNR